MKQSKLMSLIETLSSIAVGFAVSLALGAIVYPMYGHSFSLMENINITLIFTFASIVRGYAMRRLFAR